MTLALAFKPEALDELEEAAAWYEARRPGLGMEFLAEIERLNRLIRDHPEACPIWRVGYPYRRAVARRFPYVLFYLVEDRVVVMAVAHARREPGYWLGR
ncbi:MAG: type II toxin-antitoxin system RelE/ParE family toxin [Alphaproteobacteria bacterium]|nr:type II toxin-antitoxin system RelE/ParE family toxin [Alphaproteobacteria bacterium]